MGVVSVMRAENVKPTGQPFISEAEKGLTDGRLKGGMNNRLEIEIKRGRSVRLTRNEVECDQQKHSFCSWI